LHNRPALSITEKVGQSGCSFTKNTSLIFCNHTVGLSDVNLKKIFIQSLDVQSIFHVQLTHDRP
ncbi:hypothetical protein, partial [Acidithiobacillus thiooxidans]